MIGQLKHRDKSNSHARATYKFKRFLEIQCTDGLPTQGRPVGAESSKASRCTAMVRSSAVSSTRLKIVAVQRTAQLSAQPAWVQWRDTEHRLDMLREAMARIVVHRLLPIEPLCARVDGDGPLSRHRRRHDEFDFLGASRRISETKGTLQRCLPGRRVAA